MQASELCRSLIEVEVCVTRGWGPCLVAHSACRSSGGGLLARSLWLLLRCCCGNPVDTERLDKCALATQVLPTCKP